MDDKAKRRMALLMEEDDLPEVVPPRPMTPDEKRAAVQAYLLTDEGRRAIEDAVAKEAGVQIIRNRRISDPRVTEDAVDRREGIARGRDAQILEEMWGNGTSVESRRRARGVVEAAVAAAAEAEGERQRRAPARGNQGARTNDDYYRLQREAIRRNTTVSGRAAPVDYFDTDDIEMTDPFAGALEDL